MAAIMFSTAAMVVLFSVYNGIEGITKELYTAFYPDIKIVPAQGKYFEGQPGWPAALDADKAVDKWSYTLEDMALFVGTEQQKIGHVMGVSNSWFGINNVQQHMLDGQPFFTERTTIPEAVVGVRIANTLGLEADNIFSGFTIYHPRSGAKFSTDYTNAYNSLHVQPSGIFRVAAAFDDKYVLVPLQAASKLFGVSNRYSSIDIRLQPGVSFREAKKALARIVGDQFVILDKYEQNKTLYMILNSEKWAVYAILLMVMLVASFNMVGSLTMLVLEKKRDIAILKSMGAPAGTIKSIFLKSGFFLAGTGGGAGLLLGYLVCLAQKYLGLISMGEGFVVSSYPVAFKLSDFILVIISVVVTGFIASYYPAIKAARSSLIIKEE